MQFKLKHLLIAVTIIACVIGFLRATYIELTYVESAENVKRVDWLPECASNISFYRSYSFTSYEFDITEPDFVVMARDRWWDLKPIAEQVSVFRYTYCAPGIPEPTGSPTIEEYEAWEAHRCAKVRNGLYYVRQHSNGGGIWVACDRSAGRAYLHHSPR